MKKLLFLLLFLPLFLGAQIVEKYPKASGNTYGYDILKPDSYTSTGSYTPVLFMHGAAGQGDGSSAGLDNVLSQIPSNLREAINKYNLIVVAPQYSGAGNNAIMDHAISRVLAIPGVQSKKLIGTCFSMGGGEITRYISSSQENADKFSLIMVVAGLNGLQSAGIKYIVQSNLPVIYFHANNDPSASISHSKNGMAAINTLSPAIPAKGVFYADGGHDITNRVFSVSQFPWTGNEIPDNVYQYALTLTNDSPAAVPTTAGPVLPVAIADDITTTTSTIQLIGSKSRNAVADKSKWSCVSVPSGVSIWNVNACSYINCANVQLPAEGVYKFRLTVTDAAGQSAYKDISVTYSKSGTPTEPPPTTPTKTVIAKLEIIIYSDGTTETKKLQ